MIAACPGDMPDRSRRWPSRTSLTTPGEEPSRLTRGGELRVRVQGSCHGVVTCEGRRLWSWGAFAHAFVLPARSSTVEVVALGLFGVRRVRVELDPRAELREPRVALRAPASPRPPPVVLPRTTTEAPVVKSTQPSILRAALPVPPQLRSRVPSPVVRGLTLALCLPRPGESR